MPAVSEAVPGRRVPVQLPLDLQLDKEATFDNLLAEGALAAAAASLRRPPDALEPLTYLHGPAATGKSHLLQALCHLHASAVYLPLGQLTDLPPEELLADLEYSALLAIDDLQAVAGIGAWEEALFHLINRARAAHCPLALGAAAPARDIGIVLPDLRSRLAGGVTWALPAYGEVEIQAILAFRAHRRGLPLAEPVIRYLVARGRRGLPDLLASLDRLDRASMQLQRPLTVPLVREVMGW